MCGINVLPTETMRTLVSAVVLTRLDYCNGLLAELPASTLAPLCRVQKAAARLVSGIRCNDSVTAAMRKLHWLPIKFRIIYKISVTMHHVLYGQSPGYLKALIQPIASMPNRQRLRSATSSTCFVPSFRTQFGERAFSVSRPSIWNSLPEALRSEKSFSTFKIKLKTHLFDLAYNN